MLRLKHCPVPENKRVHASLQKELPLVDNTFSTPLPPISIIHPAVPYFEALPPLPLLLLDLPLPPNGSEEAVEWC